MSARVAQVGGGDEISALATTFNKMTGELQFQRRALEEAAEYAETRSVFIGAVLEGVSAGVVSLDGTNCVRAANGSAGRLLQTHDDRLEGRDFSVIAPEFMAIVASARPLHPAQKPFANPNHVNRLSPRRSCQLNRRVVSRRVSWIGSFGG
jgi:two-component system nitrogen regulation sensor histidine kinase NtrY